MTAVQPGLADIDRTLEEARVATNRLGSMLFELEEERARRSVEAGRLRGESETSWSAACEQLAVLWAWYRALTETVDSIAGLRQTGRSRHTDRLHMWRALTEPSVELSPESMQLVGHSLAGSPLLTSPTAITPLIAAMTATYERGAEVITSVCAVWDLALPRLQDIDASVAAAEDVARRAGLRLPNELGPARARLDKLRDQATHDPLGADLGEIGELSRTVTRVAGDLRDQQESVEKLEVNLEMAAGGLESMDALLGGARARHAEAAVKIAGPIPAVSVLHDADARVDRLRRDLREAAALARTDPARAVRILAALQPRLEGLRVQATGAAEAAGRPLARRRELRGLLEAYVAKAHSLGRGEDVALEQLHRHAEESLYCSPCDLAEAQRRVAEYQHALITPTNEDRT